MRSYHISEASGSAAAQAARSHTRGLKIYQFNHFEQGPGVLYRHPDNEFLSPTA